MELMMLATIVGAALFISLDQIVHCGAGGGVGQQMPEFSQPLFPDSQFIDLISRDIESVSGPIAFGHKFMSGGAGEGDQQLGGPDASFEHRQEVKSDNVLPAYCEPPNPCPLGFSGRDGCLEEFENTADFSRNYQAQQQCLCDQEHMFNCPSKESGEQDLQRMLSKNGLHKSMIAKKFHVTRAEEPRRRKRSANFEPDQQQQHHTYSRYNPYLEGEPLNLVSKKDGRNLVSQM